MQDIRNPLVDEHWPPNLMTCLFFLFIFLGEARQPRSWLWKPQQENHTVKCVVKIINSDTFMSSVSGQFYMVEQRNPFFFSF